MNKNIKLQVRAIVHTKDGRTFKKYPWKKTHSLLKQFIQLLMIQLSYTNQTIKKTDGSTYNSPPHALNLMVVGALNDTTFGILIGSGDTPVTLEDYALEAQITTNVAHALQSFALENPNASTWRISISRTFTNNTGAVLHIKEVAIYTSNYTSYVSACLERTLYAVDVPDGYPVTFQYRITITL